jgi:quercetin dioxygenase-like cupin family protein
MTRRDDDRLTEYALGLLDEAERRELERELRASAEVRAELAALERSLAELGRAEAPLRPSDELRERVLRSADPRTRFEGFVERLGAFLDLGASRARELLTQIPEPSGRAWVDDRVAGVRLLHFAGGPRVAGADCGLVHVPPGVTYPDHRHGGDEWSFVIQGLGEEDTGRLWRPGDLVQSSAGSSHAYRSIGDEPFVFAVVLYGGIRFTSDG